MRRFLLLSALTFILLSGASAQDSYKKNDVYVEAGGNGFYGSLNYERQLFSRPGLGIRIGAGFMTYSSTAYYGRGNVVDTRKLIIKIPFGINYLFNLKRNTSFIDAGIGFTYDTGFGLQWSASQKVTSTQEVKEIMALVPSIGYRRHTKHNIMWRVSFTPAINPTFSEKYSFQPWGGIAFGKRF